MRAAEPQLLVGRVVPHPGEALEDGAIVVEGAQIAWIGPANAVPARYAGAQRRTAPLWTAGLVDAHTHAAWLGSRHVEYAMKLRGEGYEAIAAKGGGIASTMRAIEAEGAHLVEVLVARLRRMRAQGVTTVEVKTGYGLRPALERVQLAALAEAARAANVPRICPTFLALHAVPPESRGEGRAAWLESAVDLCRAVCREGFVRFVDAYVDRNAFSADEARRVGRIALEHGVGVRLHVGQFADVGGAELAAELGAASVDHMEHVSVEGLAALAKAGVRVGLLPVASFVLGQTPPDVAAMRAAGLRLIVASDANPGTAPTESLPLALAFAARLYGLSPTEAFAGATVEAADSLGMPGGRLAQGAPADVVGWDLPHEDALVFPWGVSKALHVLVGGDPGADNSGGNPE